MPGFESTNLRFKTILKFLKLADIEAKGLLSHSLGSSQNHGDEKTLFQVVLYGRIWQ